MNKFFFFFYEHSVNLTSHDGKRIKVGGIRIHYATEKKATFRVQNDRS